MTLNLRLYKNWARNNNTGNNLIVYMNVLCAVLFVKKLLPILVNIYTHSQYR